MQVLAGSEESDAGACVAPGPLARLLKSNTRIPGYRRAAADAGKGRTINRMSGRQDQPTRAMLAVLLLLGLLVACSEERSPLRIGTSPWLGTEPLFLARELGHLDPETALLVEFANATQTAAALESGAVDADDDAQTQFGRAPPIAVVAARVSATLAIMRIPVPASAGAGLFNSRVATDPTGP